MKTDMEYIDISRVIEAGMAVYPDNPSVQIHQLTEAAEGKSAISQITMGSHTGTHLDAPRHINPGGAGTENYDLARLNGPVDVVDLTHVERIILAADIPPTLQPRVIIKTRNSLGDINMFDPDFVALAESAAQELASRNLCVIGIDALSVKRRGIKDRVHDIFLSLGVAIIEGLWLKDVVPGQYELMCLPLSFQGLDGAPARVVLRREK